MNYGIIYDSDCWFIINQDNIIVSSKYSPWCRGCTLNVKTYSSPTWYESLNELIEKEFASIV